MTGFETGNRRLPILPEDLGEERRASSSGSILDRQINLAELLDVDAFRDICTSFVDLYKIGIKIFDSDGTKLIDIRVGSGDWCGYIFSNKVGRPMCTNLVGKIKSHPYPGLESGQVVEQMCFSGLKYVIMPIMYGGDYLGRVIYGPFRPQDLKRPADEVYEFPDFDPNRLASYGGKIRRAPDETIIKILNNFRGVIDTVTFVAMKALMTQQLHVESISASYKELSEANRHLRVSLEKLRELDKLKSNFLAMISHELRTPLTSVIGYSEMLLEGMAGGLSGDQQDYVQTIRDKGTTLLELISSLLDFSKIEAGALRVDVGDVDVRGVVEETRTTILPQASRKNVTVATSVAGDAAELRGDKEKIRQCLVNLAGNAVKFTPDGGRIDIRVRRVSRGLDVTGGGRFGTARSDLIVFSVEDTGIGIPKDKLEQIFTSFYQVDNSITREYGGTGLGLAIVKRLVMAHKGEVAVESEPGRGTRFDLAFPAEFSEESSVSMSDLDGPESSSMLKSP